MSTLLSLPNEILLQIIEETRPDSIWAFSRCCKSIRVLGAKALAQHQRDLYRYYSSAVFFLNDRPGCRTNPYRYLSHILLKPRRTLYVKFISFQNVGLHYTGVPNTTTQVRKTTFMKKIMTMIDSPYGLIFKAISGCPYIQCDDIGKWQKRLRHGDPTALAFLVLTSLPNVEQLSISENEDYSNAELIYEVWKAILSPYHLIPGPLPLSKLHTLIIRDRARVTQPGEKPGLYETCMTLPSLRKLEASYTVTGFNRWPSAEDFPAESNVIDVTFQDSAIAAESFARLLTRTKGLQRLKYSCRNLWPRLLGDESAMGLIRTLERHIAHTLTHLDLNFIKAHPPDHPELFIGSLRQLHTLKHLRIPINMFKESESHDLNSDQVVDLLPLLPTSIETLTLLPPAEPEIVTYTLDDLRRKRERCLPNLTKITCDAAIPFMDGLVDECASVGVEFAYP